MVEIVIVWLLFAAGVAWLASARGRSGAGWFLLAFLFSPLLSVVVLACLRDLKADGQAAARDAVYAQAGGDRVKCPECAELVLREARKCKHCGAALVASGGVLFARVEEARPSAARPLRIDDDWQRRSGLPPS